VSLRSTDAGTSCTPKGARASVRHSADDAPTVVIADDHPAIRLGVRMALLSGGMRVLAEAADRDGAVSAVLKERPDICLLDVYMPGGGIQAAATLAAVAPDTAVVMLTVSDSVEDLLGALHAGAVGYLPKDTPPDRLPVALRGVLAGVPALPRALVAPVLRELCGLAVRAPGGVGATSASTGVAAGAGRGTDANAPTSTAGAATDLGPAADLTRREAEVLRLLRSGLRTAEIGRSLSLSPVTVRRHISAGVAKLGVADRQEAIGAITAGLRGPRGRPPGPGYPRPTSRRYSSRSA
jgi:DNA-binding NarL/FixJ family response regulator